MAKQVEAFEKKNAQLAIISNGEPHHIKPFRKSSKYHGKLYTDPSLKTYEILNFKRSVGSLFGIKSFTEGVRSVGTGHLMKGIRGDSLQQGGAVIVGPGETIHYSYINKEAGDHPPIKEMLDACDN
ncbi:MAG: hypothetical protein GY749_36375 [Desulfobacteraceae bacterium]|nr:hypothetical protein [Desulfobacteraceae bacterium]